MHLFIRNTRWLGFLIVQFGLVWLSLACFQYQQMLGKLRLVPPPILKFSTGVCAQFLLLSFINCELEEDSSIFLLIFSPSSPFPYSSHFPSPLSPALLAPEFCPINLGTLDPQDSHWILNYSSLTTGFGGAAPASSLPTFPALSLGQSVRHGSDTGTHLSGITIHYCQMFICLKTLLYLCFYFFLLKRKIYPWFSHLDLGPFVKNYINLKLIFFPSIILLQAMFQDKTLSLVYFCVLLYNTVLYKHFTLTKNSVIEYFYLYHFWL